MKKVLFWAGLFLVAVMLMSGCGTSANPGLSISGTISGLNGEAGLVGVVASTISGNFFADDSLQPEEYPVAAGQTSVDYSVAVPSSGTYYVYAVHLVGTPEARLPASGDFAGQYSNGLFPAVFEQEPSGNPEPIEVAGSSVTGKNFQLLVEIENLPDFENPPTGLSISGTVTLPEDHPGGILAVIPSTVNGDFINQDPDLEDNFNFFPVIPGRGTVVYEVPVASAGTYYVYAILLVNATEPREPETGDYAGQYLDGAFPPELGQSPSGAPLGIKIESDPVAGKDFPLLVTLNIPTE